MKIAFYLLLAATIGFFVLWFILARSSMQTDTQMSGVTTITNDLFGVTFTYPKEPNEYTIIETARTVADQSTFRYRYTLMEATQYLELANAPDGREAPPSINIEIYDNVGAQTASEWADTMSLVSNWELRRSDAVDVSVGAKSGIMYKIDGLYPATIYVVTSGEYVYVLTGAYLAPEDQIVKDFTAMVNSITFTN
jgi:hypothetical protein